MNLLEIFTGLVVFISGATAQAESATAELATSPAPAVVAEEPGMRQAYVSGRAVQSAPAAIQEPEFLKSMESAKYLDLSNQVDRVAALITSNEGDIDAICWNDNGHGVSVGMFQANQRRGELPALLKTMSNDPDGRRQMLNAFGSDLTVRIEENPEIVRNLAIKKNNWLGRGLKQLAQTKTFEELQIEILREKVRESSKLAAAHGIHSTLGVAMVADLANQWGKGGARRFMKYASDINDEEAKILAIVNKVDTSSIYGERYKGNLKKAEELGLTVDETFLLDELS